MFHSKMHIKCDYSILNPFVGVGAIAMTGFFLLSGYSLRLVYGNQDLMAKKNLVKYYLKRILSIIPLYYFFAILYILLMGKETIGENLLLFPVEALGLQSAFASLSHHTHNGGTWFVSCIILAYVVYPFLQTISKQLPVRYKAILLIVLVFLDIWGAVVSHRFGTYGIYDNPFFRIVEVLCGVIVADLNIGHDCSLLRILRSWSALIISTLILFVGVSLIRYFLRIDDYMLYNVIVLPCFITILFSLGAKKFKSLERIKIIPYLGKISYAFFLTQFFPWVLWRWIVQATGCCESNWMKILFTFTYCLLSAILVYELVQKPIANLVKKKLAEKLG